MPVQDLGSACNQSIEAFNSDPRRVSLLGHSTVLASAYPLFRGSGLKVDFHATSLDYLSNIREVLLRDGLGTLAVIGSVQWNEHISDDFTWLLPKKLGELGLGDTPTVFIPLTYKDTNYLRPGFTRVLDINETVNRPRDTILAGIELIKDLIGQEHFVTPES